MQLEKRFEILEGLPPYGPSAIPITYTELPFYSEGFVVRFFNKNGTSWIANFEPGWTNLNEVIDYPDINKVFVVAGGACFIMDPSNQTPITKFGFSYKSILSVDDGRFILVDVIDVTVIETNLSFWHSLRISWDGLEDVKLEGHLLKGLSYTPVSIKGEWIPFTLNINTKELIGGAYNL